jgi:hypothetical protein
MSRRGRLLVLALVVISMCALASWTTTPAEAACDELAIPSLGLSRCVVAGNQVQVDEGHVVRFSSLSGSNVSWLAGHRNSHGSTFSTLPGLKIGAQATYRGVSYRVVEYRLVDRLSPGDVVGWRHAASPQLVLQTSELDGRVHVWRAVATPTAPPPIAPSRTAPAVFVSDGPDRSGPVTEPVGAPAGVEITAPTRLFDTRASGGALRAGEVRRFDVPASAGLPADTQALLLNVTVVGVDPAGWVEAGACSAERGAISTVNWRGVDAAANTAIVAVEQRSFCVTASAAVHVVLDLQGYVSPAARTGLVPVAPARLLDTRQEAAGMTAGQLRRIQLPSDLVGARGAEVTVTAIGSSRPGFVSVQSCAQPAGLSSTVNTRLGVAVANSTAVPVDDGGGFCVFSHDPAQVIVDLTAVFVAGGDRYQPVRPVRLVDTRQAAVPDQHRGLGGRPLDAGATLRFPASGWRGVPSNSALAVNVTSVEPSAPGFVAAWDCASARPETSVQNPRPAEAVASRTLVSAGGEVCVYSATASHVIVDLVGVWVR